jgi:RNA polymerase sigma-70 factor (ECF subfamily)
MEAPRACVLGMTSSEVGLGETGETDDGDLLAAIAAGDRHAFATLMRRHAPPMLALAERVTGSADDADEIVQDCFVKIWTAPTRWRPDGKARFSTWFYRVVFNAAIDRRRARGLLPLEEADDVPDTAPGGFETSMASQCYAVVARSLGDLPDRQRAALSLHYFAGASAPRTALILGISVPSVEALLVRGRKAMRRALNRRGIDTLGDVL